MHLPRLRDGLIGPSKRALATWEPLDVFLLSFTAGTLVCLVALGLVLLGVATIPPLLLAGGALLAAVGLVGISVLVIRNVIRRLISGSV